MPVQVEGLGVAAALLTKNSEPENTLKEWENWTQHSSSVEGRTQWRIQAEPPVRAAGWVWKAGAKSLRVAAVSQSLSQRGEPNPTCGIKGFPDW